MTASYETEKSLCDLVRGLCKENKYEECKNILYSSMSRFPDSAIPHNLLGVVLERMNNHQSAMKHFRAAWALDPTYQPASINLHNFGTFYSKRDCYIFDESDISENNEKKVRIVRDEKGIGRVFKNTKIEYDKNGIGHVIKEEL